jgi:hypothetical protein
MSDTKERTVSYRRAEWLVDEPGSINLASCVKQCCQRLKTVDERSFVRSSGQVVKLLSMKEESAGGVYLHITADTPGEAASVVPRAGGVEEVEIATTEPPPDSEFMDSDAFVYISKNDVCFCSTGMRDGGIVYILQELFQKSKIRRDSTMFDLIKVADLSKLALINASGVKEIVIGAQLYKATLNYEKRKGHTVSILAAAAKQIKAILGKENDVTNDSLKVGLSLSVDRRFRGKIVLGERRIKELAVDLLRNQQEGDDFVIITNDGQKISPNELYVKMTALIEALGKSVTKESAWKHLRAFYLKLDKAGALEQ